MTACPGRGAKPSRQTANGLALPNNSSITEGTLSVTIKTFNILLITKRYKPFLNLPVIAAHTFPGGSS
jgi:hypothetical protein